MTARDGNRTDIRAWPDTLRRLKELEKAADHSRTTEYPRPWGAVIGAYLGLPELRSFWPYSSFTPGGNLWDLVQQKTLTATGAPTRAVYGDTVPYANLNGTTQYYARATETHFDITGPLTLGQWVYLDVTSGTRNLVGKFNPTGNQRSYLLQENGGVPAGRVSGDGTAVIDVFGANIVASAWYSLVVRYTPSTELALFVRDAKTVNVTSIPASLFVSTSDFRVGVLGDTTGFMDGRVCLSFLCAAALSDNLIKSLFRQSRVFFDI